MVVDGIPRLVSEYDSCDGHSGDTYRPNALPEHTAAVHQSLPPRPKLEPTFPSSSIVSHPSAVPFSLAGISEECGEASELWIELISAPAYAPLASWIYVMEQLIRHPERNSTNILRADITREAYSTEEEPKCSQIRDTDWKQQWTMTRTILPRRPNLDWEMQQQCSFYLRPSRHEDGDDGVHDSEQAVEDALIVYTPLVGSLSHPRMKVNGSELVPELGKPPRCEAFVPFYHPKVRALAFRYRSLAQTNNCASSAVFGQLSISIVPFQPCPTAFPGTHKLSRVGLSLLTTLHVHTWGHLHSYQKRVYHDQIVPRNAYQDLYLLLKHRYAAQLIEGWKEATDPQKHVFEDLGIAAFLISLWQPMYSRSKGSNWRGSVKFVDVGCGNGLLTHILSLEGFKGVGLDLRSRKSWEAYQDAGTELSEWTFEPSSLLNPNADDAWQGAFLIGNHADELTPWIPLLATHHQCVGFINIPCCYYALEGGKNFTLTLKREKATRDSTNARAHVQDIPPSRNQQYLAYIANLTLEFGWKVELEALRIPSTKNWAFVGRTPAITSAQGTKEHDALRNLVVERVKEVNHTWTARVVK